MHRAFIWIPCIWYNMCNTHTYILYIHMLIPYSGKFSEGKIYGNLPFTNTSEIKFRKLCTIFNL